MSVEFISARKNKKAFRNLLNAYLAELSQYNKRIVCNEDGIYEPWLLRELLRKEYDSFLIIREERLVGLVVIGQGGLQGSEHNIEEFYIIPSFRKKGCGREAACKVLALYRGEFHLHVLKKNEKARAFWENTLKSLNISYTTGSDSVVADYMRFTVSAI